MLTPARATSAITSKTIYRDFVPGLRHACDTVPYYRMCQRGRTAMVFLMTRAATILSIGLGMLPSRHARFIIDDGIRRLARRRASDAAP